MDARVQERTLDDRDRGPREHAEPELPVFHVGERLVEESHVNQQVAAREDGGRGEEVPSKEMSAEAG